MHLRATFDAMKCNKGFILLWCLVTKYFLLLSKIQTCLCRYTNFPIILFDNLRFVAFLTDFQKRLRYQISPKNIHL